MSVEYTRRYFWPALLWPLP